MLGISFLLDKIIVSVVPLIRSIVFDSVFVWIADNISQLAIVLFATVILSLGRKKIRDVLSVWISSLVSGTITYFLKMWIARPRPEISILIDKTNYAFPSGHMAVLFACLPVLEKEFPRLKIYFWLFAAVIAFARLYTGVHYLSDLVAGALLGYVIGRIYIWFYNKKLY